MSTKLKTRPAAAPTTAATEPPADPMLEGLNAAQREAVLHGEGPLLIVAGAGTGKTTVITRRIARLITTGAATPEQILALTFTDKAAGEMVERIDARLPMGYVDLWVSTFHAFCQRLLQTHGLDIGLPDDFRLLSQTDAYLLVRRNFDKFDLDYYKPLGNPTKFIYALLSHFSRAKDEHISPADYLAHASSLALDRDRSGSGDGTDDSSRLAEIANAYHVYQKLLRDEGCLDLGDLVVETLRLLRERPLILAKYRAQFTHVIVDEFQDTNWSQFELLKLLAGDAANITVVGDDDQSIYKFRGASISNILQFKDAYPKAREVVLTENFRSKQNILDLAYGFIQQNNPNRLEFRLKETRKKGETPITKQLRAAREGTAVIEHLRFETHDDEVAGTVGKILELRESGAAASWSDICILVRSNGTAEPFSDELRRRGIPYQFLALKGLYAKPIVLDCLAYFRLLDDYHESSALYRVLSSPAYRIDAMDLLSLTHAAKKGTVSLFEQVRAHAAMKDLREETHATLERLIGHIAQHTQLAQQKPVSEVLVRFLYDSGYAALLTRDDSTEARERVSYLKQFLNRIRRFEQGHDDPRLAHFMEEYDLERESGDAGGLQFDPDAGPDMVRIMTIHAAKGLEFPHVFLVGMVAQRFPAVDRGGGIEIPDALAKEILPEGDVHLEEERRLCYVAVTRARDGLFFTSASDYGGKTKKKPSRFLEELGFKDSPTLTVGDGGMLLPIETAERPVMPYEPPDYFSFTQLAAYDTCPLQYKYAHVLRIPVLGNFQMSYGKTMHAALEKFMGEVAARRAAAQASLFSDARPAGAAAGLPVSKDELLAMYEAAWIDEWYPDKATKEQYRAEGRASLSRLYDEMAAAPPQPLLLEKDFKLKFGEHCIRGKIDRIDALPDGGVEIVDYKTGNPKEEGKLRPEDKRQLLLYQLAVGRLMGLDPKKLTFLYLRDGSRVEFLGSEKEIAKFEEDTEAAIGRIRSGNFDPKPGMACKFCDFRNICESSEA